MFRFHLMLILADHCTRFSMPLLTAATDGEWWLWALLFFINIENG